MNDGPALGTPVVRVKPFKTATAAMAGAAVVLAVALASVAATSADRPILRFHVAAGAACSLILGAAMIALALRPRENVAALQLVVAGAIASLVAGSLGGEVTRFLFFTPAVAAVVAVLLYPWNADIWRLGEPRPVLFAIAVATAVPLIVYAVTQPHLQVHASTGEPQVRLDHYTGAALAGLFASIAVAVAGIGAPGWRVVGWIASAAFGTFGVLVIAFAGSVDALSHAWGWAGIAVGVLTLVATEVIEHRSTANR